jgi:hypothetical protein
MVFEVAPDVGRQRLREMIDQLPRDGWVKAFDLSFPAMVEMVSRDYPRLVGLSQLETMSRDILVA